MRQIPKDIEVGAKVVTRDNRKGRVICNDLKDDCSIVVALVYGDREELVMYPSNGNYTPAGESAKDIFLPPKTEYVNLYRKNNGRYKAGNVIFNSKEEAERLGKNPLDYEYIQTIPVEVK